MNLPSAIAQLTEFALKGATSEERILVLEAAASLTPQLIAESAKPQTRDWQYLATMADSAAALANRLRDTDEAQMRFEHLLHPFPEADSGHGGGHVDGSDGHGPDGHGKGKA